jgi:hypothetical protein
MLAVRADHHEVGVDRDRPARNLRMRPALRKMQPHRRGVVGAGPTGGPLQPALGVVARSSRV